MAEEVTHWAPTQSWFEVEGQDAATAGLTENTCAAATTSAPRSATVMNRRMTHHLLTRRHYP